MFDLKALEPSWNIDISNVVYYKRGWGSQLGATEKQIQVVIRVGLEPGTSDTLTTRPRCLQSFNRSRWQTETGSSSL